MLAFSLLRYWWTRPQIADPVNYVDHDPIKSKTIASHLEPFNGPQLSKTQLWSKIPHFHGGVDPMRRSVIEIEQAIAEGRDLILVEAEVAGQLYFHYVSYGWLLQENTIFYGSLSLWCAYAYPRSWFLYGTCALFSLMHSWVYFRVYKYDRLSQYQAYDDDRHPVSNLITAWILGQRPAHFQYVLKKERVYSWEISSEIILYLSVAATLVRMMQVEDYAVEDRFVAPVASLPALASALNASAYISGYFQPEELIVKAPGCYLPSDIPYIQGWFDLPYLNVQFRPIKKDLAIIICGVGVYFLYKAFEHYFFIYDESDELRREWFGNEDTKLLHDYKNVDPNWVDIREDGLVALARPPDPQTKAELDEQLEITRIANQIPYGWEPPGYPENHYGIFT